MEDPVLQMMRNDRNIDSICFEQQDGSFHSLVKVEEEQEIKDGPILDVFLRYYHIFLARDLKLLNAQPWDLTRAIYDRDKDNSKICRQLFVGGAGSVEWADDEPIYSFQRKLNEALKYQTP